MIILKTAGEIDTMAEAARVVAETLEVLKKEVRPGITTEYLDRIAEENIRMRGALPAFKGYRNYPRTLCASVNQEVVHGIPSAARVLREGGRLVVLEFFRPTRRFTRIVHVVYNETLLPLVGWAVTGDREAYRYLPRSIGRFDSEAEYRARLEKARFTDISIEPLTFGVASIVRATRGAA